MEMKTYGEQYAIYKAWNKKKRLRDITMTYEDEWKNWCAKFYANGFWVIPINNDFSAKLTRGYVTHVGETIQAIIANPIHLSNSTDSNIGLAFLRNDIFNNIRFYNYYELFGDDNTMNHNIFSSIIVCYFATSKQNRVEYCMKNMLLAVMHEHFQEMKPEKLRKRRMWKMMEIVLCDVYVLKHIMKY